jgi:lipopolysaccharide/colanic/teichoic acid biosynthesis glycosyltransferase
MSQSDLDALERRLILARDGHARSPSRWVQTLRRWWISHADATAKRWLDIAVCGFALLLLAPFAVLLAVAIRLEDRGPVLYWQKRVGLRGHVFDFPKFRSMRTDSDEIRKKLEQLNEHGSAGVTFKMENDPRITRIGRFIRKTSIDELPQLWSIFMGHMSLVGPRPALPQEVAQYTLSDRRRLEGIPGLTCIWQVSGRSQIPFHQQVELDVLYIETRSVFLDIELIFKTVPAVLFARGAS